MTDVCGDNRFEIINRAKKDLIEATNIESREEEMKVLDDFLFRCWQMGWLKRYESVKDDTGAITYECPYALLEEWTKRLGLQDWVIRVNDNCKPEDMAVEDSDGCSEWSESIKCARIDILGEEYYGERIRPYDFERILVHELLHLKTSLISSEVPDLQERYTHQLIDDLARALVNAKRGE